ncbi:hypothetical protein QBC34DRAFT_437346 [Podospora aff. communis PSN243]|uniref:Uncharacterized protein n=1 Tax=Podospora aff. communis PSN243 TaxID=3040156 RepID=A0AAV9GQL1_9PEZI|nr:hypothetical protein QBC34DRAFT_437346 [Podospora aff. communis PSN243]
MDDSEAEEGDPGAEDESRYTAHEHLLPEVAAIFGPDRPCAAFSKFVFDAFDFIDKCRMLEAFKRLGIEWEPPASSSPGSPGYKPIRQSEDLLDLDSTWMLLRLRPFPKLYPAGGSGWIRTKLESLHQRRQICRRLVVAATLYNSLKDLDSELDHSMHPVQEYDISELEEESIGYYWVTAPTAVPAEWIGPPPRQTAMTEEDKETRWFGNDKCFASTVPRVSCLPLVLDRRTPFVTRSHQPGIKLKSRVFRKGQCNRENKNVV